MGRKKKKRGRVSAPKATQEKAEAFNPALKGPGPSNLLGKGRSGEEKKEDGPVEPRQEPDEYRYFSEAMSDVVPLAGKKTRVPRTANAAMRPAHPAKNDDLEVMVHLSDLVSGIAEMDITFSDEYIEGAVQGFDRKLMQRLKGGQFSVQDHLDLHGLTKQEAEIRIRDFLLTSYRAGLRCVLVVHGRGLNSENHIPVLKERLPTWLSRGPARRLILAFCTARPYDGGTGAIYILLRRPKGRV